MIDNPAVPFNPAEEAVIVVGGTQPESIGETITQTLLGRGYRVIQLDLKPSPRAFAGSYEFDLMDVGSEADVIRACKVLPARIKRFNRRLAGVIYAAGVNHLGSVDDLSPDAFDEMVEVNAKGVWMFTRELRRALNYGPNTRGEHVPQNDPVKTIVLGSNTAYVAKTRSFGYAFSKAGMVHMLRCMHRELAPTGWEFTSLDFGIVMDSGMTDKTVRELGEQRGWSAEEAREMLLRNVPSGEPVSRREIAETVTFLLRPEVRTFGGSSVRFDGGQQQG